MSTHAPTVTLRLPADTISKLDAERGTRSEAIRRRLDEHRQILDAHRQSIDVRPIVAMMAAEGDRRRGQ